MSIHNDYNRPEMAKFKFKRNSYTSEVVTHQSMQCPLEASEDKPQNIVEKKINVFLVPHRSGQLNKILQNYEATYSSQ